MQRGFSPIIVLVILGVLGIASVIGYMSYSDINRIKALQEQARQRQQQAYQEALTKAQTQQTPVPTNNEKVDQEQMKTFQSTQYKFSLSYPASWSYKENDPAIPHLAEYSVTFASPDENTVLDIWVVDHSWAEAQKDIPQTATRTTIAGQPAITIQSRNTTKTTYINHPSFSNKILTVSSLGNDLSVTDNIQQTLKFSQ
jgi:type II secretory pathway pseudopilin PulG